MSTSWTSPICDKFSPISSQLDCPHPWLSCSNSLSALGLQSRSSVLFKYFYILDFIGNKQTINLSVYLQTFAKPKLVWYSKYHCIPWRRIINQLHSTDVCFNRKRVTACNIHMYANVLRTNAQDDVYTYTYTANAHMRTCVCMSVCLFVSIIQ